MNRAGYILLIAGCAADLGKELDAGDTWRTCGLALLLLLLLGLRRELTKPNP